MVCARHPRMHLTPTESNRSVVSRQVCVELTRPGAHFISLQLMARSIHAFICYNNNNNNNNNNMSFRLRKKRRKLIKNQLSKLKESTGQEQSDRNTHHDWCTCNCLGECKGRLLWDVRSTRYFWKRPVVSHPWYCPYLAYSVMSLSCGIAAETWLRIPRKRPGEDHTIIMVDLEAPVKPE